MLANKGVQILAIGLLKRNVYCLSRPMSIASPEDRVPVRISEPENSKLLKVAFVGVPNAGKSTLINKLMAIDVCPVSKKAHTTRRAQRAVFLEKETQLVFTDTPGMVNKKEIKKFEIPDEFAIAPEECVRKSDVIAVIHSIENKILRNKLDPKVINVLQKFPMKPSILIINKIDKITGKRELLETVYHLCDGFVAGRPIPVSEQKQKERKLNLDAMIQKTQAKLAAANLSPSEPAPEEPEEQSTSENNANIKEISYAKYEKIDKNGRVVRGWPSFQEAFLISALAGNGVDNLRNYLKSNARLSAWAYNSEVLTDLPPADFALQTVKSLFLEHFKKEIPYLIEPQLQFWDTNEEGVLRIVVGIKVQHQRILYIVLSGGILDVIKQHTENAISTLLRVPVDLFINVSLHQPERKRDRRGG